MKPVLMTVDDDREVLRAVERDLRRHYGEKYRVVRAESGSSALDALKKLKLRNDPVALLLVDQRMPEMTGVEFLEHAMEWYPDAKRALLTAYADTDAAIRAINTARVEYYLMKPWDPPEERLYLVLDDLLDDWQASFQPPFEGIRIVGHRWSAKSHLIKEFLARNHVPYQWLDIEKGQEARTLIDSAAADDLQLPLVLFADGSHLTEPTNAAIAEKIGLRTRAEQPFYDMIVVGAGPAGLAAAVYGASEGLRTALIEREAPGGQAGMSSRIENYLGFPSGVSGEDLARRAVTQAKRFGTEIVAQGSGRPARGGPLTCRDLGGRKCLGVSGPADCDGSGLSKVGRAGRRQVHRSRCLLWRGDDGGAVMPWRGRLHRGWGEFSRPSGGVFRQVCQAGHHAGPRHVTGSEYVPVFDRPDPGDSECRGGNRCPRRGDHGRHQSPNHHHSPSENR